MKCLKALNCAIKRWGWWGMAALAAGWRIARAFGMAVLVVDPFVAAEDINEPGLQKTTLEALFREADIVSLHLSSGPHSDGW
ncbi:hypothetical protein BANRA_00002 [Klebsiella pneumoniae]|nr:hypothetical protein BANRA_00002 [Klebsiella pneumoniae]